MVTSIHSAGNPRPFETATNVDQAFSEPDYRSILPVRFQPFPDELLSSWLVRLAWMNAEKLQTFKRRFWLHPGSPWGRNIDLTLPEDALSKITGITLVDREVLTDHMLSSYSGRLFEQADPHGNAPGILAGRRTGQKVLGYGLQLCPDCLHSDSTPYFRKWWRTAYSVVCPLHHRTLIDACPQCHQPLAYHTADFGKSLLPEHLPTSFCANCQYNYCAELPIQDESLPDNFIEWQIRLLEAMESGWFNDPRTGPIYALSYFEGLRTLIRLVASDGHCVCLREVIASETGYLPLGVVHSGNQNLFGSLRIGDRIYLLRYVFWLLQEWPERFIWATRTAQLAFSYIDYYNRQSILAYWIASVAELARDYRHVAISEEERKSVIHFLENHDMPVNANEINKWLGRWYV